MYIYLFIYPFIYNKGFIQAFGQGLQELQELREENFQTLSKISTFTHCW